MPDDLDILKNLLKKIISAADKRYISHSVLIGYMGLSDSIDKELHKAEIQGRIDKILTDRREVFRSRIASSTPLIDTLTHIKAVLRRGNISFEDLVIQTENHCRTNRIPSYENDIRGCIYYLLNRGDLDINQKTNEVSLRVI